LDTPDFVVGRSAVAHGVYYVNTVISRQRTGAHDPSIGAKSDLIQKCADRKGAHVDTARAESLEALKFEVDAGIVNAVVIIIGIQPPPVILVHTELFHVHAATGFNRLGARERNLGRNIGRHRAHALVGDEFPHCRHAYDKQQGDYGERDHNLEQRKAARAADAGGA